MSHSLKKLGIELSDLEQKSKMSSFRINLDKIFATLSVTMFTFSIYFWYLFMTDFMAEAAAGFPNFPFYSERSSTFSSTTQNSTKFALTKIQI